jgi:phosphoribosylanthranilate isomerase
VIGSFVRLGIKVCGLIAADDAIACLAAGADWIGLNFHPASPRFVDPNEAGPIIEAVSPPARVVGLFLNRSPTEVASIADRLGIQIIQLHGDEPPEDLVQLQRFWIIRAFRLGSVSDLRSMNEYLARAEAIGRFPDAVLVDALVAGKAGGTGTLIADEFVRLLPPIPRLILAGGLTPENVTERVAQMRPWMVDVATGVESTPGRKDPAKLAAFVRAARSLPM